jgi:hypothetical protein
MRSRRPMQEFTRLTKAVRCNEFGRTADNIHSTSGDRQKSRRHTNLPVYRYVACSSELQRQRVLVLLQSDRKAGSASLLYGLLKGHQTRVEEGIHGLHPGPFTTCLAMNPIGVACSVLSDAGKVTLSAAPSYSLGQRSKLHTESLSGSQSDSKRSISKVSFQIPRIGNLS